MYLAFLKTILAALFRTFGLLLRFLPSIPSFLHDHFTTHFRIFPVFLSVSTTDKLANRSIHAHALTWLNVFALRGFILRDIHKKKEGVRAIRAIKYKKYVAGKYTCARAPLAQKNTNQIFESNDGTTIIKIVNKIERHIFCLNQLLTKPNRTEIQTYKVEERTIGTPCIFRFLKHKIISF